jgi:hypothetical protein
MSSTWSVSFDGNDLMLNHLSRFPVFVIAEVKSLLFFRSLELDVRLKLFPLITPSCKELLTIADVLEFSSKVFTLDELCYQFGYSQNAILRRLFKLKLADFPIEITPSTVRFVG